MTKAPWFRDGTNRIRFFYLLTQGAFGIYMPFINVYFGVGRGLSGREIGWLFAVAPLMTLLVAPVWGSAADAQHSRLRTLRWALAGTAGTILLVGQVESFWQILLAVSLFAAFQVAIIPLGDGVVAACAAAQKVSFGSLRLWGSVGFAAGGLLFGQFERWFGLGAIFPIYAILIALAVPAAWQMVPREPLTHRQQDRTLALLKDYPLTRFLIVAGIAATGITAGYIFLYVFLAELGASAGLMGSVSAIGALTEVPAMLWGGRMIRRNGPQRVFAVGIALFCLAWGLYAFLPSPTYAPLVQAFNGLAMGLLWPAGVTFVAQRAPAGRVATAQALLSAVMYGVAPLVASPLAGTLFDLAGARIVLASASAILLFGLVLFGLTASKDAQDS